MVHDGRLIAKPRGKTWNGFEYVHWRKEKKRKRKLFEMNMRARRAAIERAKRNA